jgi:hypothetical protein
MRRGWHGEAGAEIQGLNVPHSEAVLGKVGHEHLEVQQPRALCEQHPRCGDRSSPAPRTAHQKTTCQRGAGCDGHGRRRDHAAQVCSPTHPL